VKKTKPGSFKL